MGKSGGKKKKGSGGGGVGSVSNSNHAPVGNAGGGGVGGSTIEDWSILLKRAHELKEEGNKRFQSKDYTGALEQYESAIRLTPKSHPDRAVFHSNRAACLMQMKPIDYDSVIAECSMAIQVQPGFVRALLRRARAYEAVGKFELAMQDVQVLLDADSNHRDALEIARRLRTALGPRQEAQQDLHSRPSPAALGASAVRGAPIGGLGPILPARPVKKGITAAVGASAGSKSEKQQEAAENGQQQQQQQTRNVVKPSMASAKVAADSGKELSGEKEKQSLASSSSSRLVGSNGRELGVVGRLRPVKLVYDHDIRLVQMPVNCSFKVLREIVSKRFPFSKSVLIKYKDNDGDLVTVTSTSELKSAESAADGVVTSKNGDPEVVSSVGMLRLHIVEVSPEQEPGVEEEEEEVEQEEKLVESEGNKSDKSVSDSLVVEESVLEAADGEMEKEEAPKEKAGAAEDPESSKEIEMDDWLFDFAQLFRTHVGIDPDAHVDLHELGMELCTEALEETVTSEEAQVLFDKAAQKFQEVAALAFFNWGNVHMCAARKRIPLDESSAGEDVVAAQLQTAYDWVKEKYSSAREKYEEALVIKPDFYEGLLALGQQQFEMAKLHWSFALAKKMDLSGWDSAATLELFDSAELKMKAATEMWEKMEEQRAGNELKDPNSVKKDEWLRKRKKHAGEGEAAVANGGHTELTPEEAAEQAAVMRSQIHLFWGNMLFERSQVECKLQTGDWKQNLDAAVERFRLAGASEADIAMVLKNHYSNEGPKEGEEKKAANPNGVIADEEVLR